MTGVILTSLRLPFLTRLEGEGRVVVEESRDEWARSVTHLVRQTRGQVVGWAGPALSSGDSLCPPPGTGLEEEQVIPVFLSQDQVEDQYLHCRRALWPLLHSMADRAEFHESHWAQYSRVNNIFAEATLAALRRLTESRPGEMVNIIINDYHLMAVPDIVKRVATQEGLACRIGYFHHVPFPPWDMIKVHPWKDFFLQGILGSDLIGFQSSDYALNFLDCCERGLGTRVERRLMMVEHGAGGRKVKVRALPLGIPFERFGSLAERAESGEICVERDTQVVVSVDTLDYTKGLTHRIAAFERLLDKYHIHQHKVVLYQVCVASRHAEGALVLGQLQEKVAAVNQRFGDHTWTPVVLITRALEEEELAALYRDSNVAMVLPLRDGMNLTGKEFVACRIYRNKPGVLLLSAFTGAADQMTEALIVNPYEESRVADYLHTALTMSTAEAEVRMTALRARESQNDLAHWMDSFFTELRDEVSECQDLRVPRVMESLKVEDISGMLGGYLGERGWGKLCLLLDYDGTLAPHGSHPDLTVLPEATRTTLQRLANMPEVFIAVITGRCVPDIRSKVNIKNITYAGNHGIDIRHPDGTVFVPPMPEEVEERASWLLQRLQAECCEAGAWVENKGIVLALHHEAWREAGVIQEERRETLLGRARDLITEAGFRIGMSDGGNVTEAKPGIKWDKGDAAIYILRSAFGVNWKENIRIIFAGDDLTDEDAMKALKGLAYSFRVVNSGLVQTLADHRLPDTGGVLTMLTWVERFMLDRRRQK